MYNVFPDTKIPFFGANVRVTRSKEPKLLLYLSIERDQCHLLAKFNDVCLHDTTQTECSLFTANASPFVCSPSNMFPTNAKAILWQESLDLIVSFLSFPKARNVMSYTFMKIHTWKHLLLNWMTLLPIGSWRRIQNDSKSDSMVKQTVYPIKIRLPIHRTRKSRMRTKDDAEHFMSLFPDFSNPVAPRKLRKYPRKPPSKSVHDQSSILLCRKRLGNLPYNVPRKKRWRTLYMWTKNSSKSLMKGSILPR